MSRKIATLWDKNTDKPDSNEGQQAFYAGGSEHSGQQILGPSNPGSSNPDRLVSDLFEQARQVASVQTDTEGRGVTITFWRNGFSVGEGELRSYQDPANNRFIETIRRGETPAELARTATGEAVDVKLVNKAQEDYKAPTVSRPFTGQGHRLGP